MVDNRNHRREERTQENLHYFFRRQKDRWAEFRGIPIIKDWPSNHIALEEPSNTLIIAAIKDGHDVDKLVHAMMYAHWVNDANVSNLYDLTKNYTFSWFKRRQANRSVKFERCFGHL